MAIKLTIDDWEFAQKRPCCGVLATAVAAQTTFKEAWAYFLGIQPGAIRYSGRWKGGLTLAEIEAGLKNFGVQYREFRWDDAEHAPPADVAGKSLRWFICCAANPATTYFVITTGHAQIVQGSMIMDQKGPTKLGDYWGGNKKIKHVWQIIEAPQAALDTLGLPLFDYVLQQKGVK